MSQLTPSQELAQLATTIERLCGEFDKLVARKEETRNPSVKLLDEMAKKADSIAGCNLRMSQIWQSLGKGDEARNGAVNYGHWEFLADGYRTQADRKNLRSL